MRRKWLVIAVVALLGAAGGAYLGNRIAPDVTGVVASLAVAGLGFGGLVGVLVSGFWRSPKRPPPPDEPFIPAAATTVDPQPESVPPAAEIETAAITGPPPPPEDQEPGWYPDATGVRRYWDGERWTEIVWRDRQGRGRTGRR